MKHINHAILAFATLLLCSNAYACKPAPIEKCPYESMIPFDRASFAKLEKATHAFQKLLDDSIAASDSFRRDFPPRNSCFNNHFAAFYLAEIRDAIEAERLHRTCSQQIKPITDSLGALFNAQSEEWKAVTDVKAITKLEKEAKRLQLILRAFHKAHKQL